jgi:hypothetical protein
LANYEVPNESKVLYKIRPPIYERKPGGKSRHKRIRVASAFHMGIVSGRLPYCCSNCRDRNHSANKCPFKGFTEAERQIHIAEVSSARRVATQAAADVHVTQGSRSVIALVSSAREAMANDTSNLSYQELCREYALLEDDESVCEEAEDDDEVVEKADYSEDSHELVFRFVRSVV